MTDPRTDWELLSKADVLRQYRYPSHLLDADVLSGAIPAFLSDGRPAAGERYNWGRLYIPRLAVERRIAALAGMEDNA